MSSATKDLLSLAPDELYRLPFETLVRPAEKVCGALLILSKVAAPSSPKYSI